MIQTSANAKTHAATAGIPAWLNGVPVLGWKAVPGSLMKDMDYTPQLNAGLSADNKGTPGAGFNFYGSPISGFFGYGSWMLRASDSMVLGMGGGGAGAWAGNDIRGLPLLDDAPRWRTLVDPSPASNVWGSRYQQVPATGPHSRMKDGVTPNARHTSWMPQFDDVANRVYLMGCALVWESDSDPPYPDKLNVDSISLDDKQWTGPGAHPNLLHTWGYQGFCVCSDRTKRRAYIFGGSTLDVFDWPTNTISTLVSSGPTQWDRGSAAVDPVNNLILHIGWFTTTPNQPTVINLANGALTQAVLTGTYASAIIAGAGPYGAGMCYCPDLGCFLYFPDDGFVYAITKTDLAHWAVDRLVTTGVGPAPHISGNAGTPQVWSRFQYVPALKGVVVGPVWNQPAFFLRIV